jgi:hypothetical protein
LRHFISVVLFVVLTHAAWAQPADFSVNWGISNAKMSKLKTTEIIGEDEGCFYVLRTSTQGLFGGRQLFLEKFDKIQLKQLFSVNVETSRFENTEWYLEYAVKLNQHLCLFFSSFNKKQQEAEVHVMMFNTDGQKSNERLLTIIPCEKISEGYYVSFNLQINPEQLLLIHNYPMEKNNKLRCMVMDFELNRMSEYVNFLPYDGKDYVITNFSLINSRFLYLLGYESAARGRSSNNPRAYMTYSIDQQQNPAIIKGLEISVGGKYISDARFVLQPEGMILTGYYTADRNQQNAQGYFHAKVDTVLNEITPLMYYPFGNTTKLYGGANENNYLDLYLNQVIEMPEGLMLVGEQFTKQTICNTDFRTAFYTCNDYFYFGKIVVTYLANNGKNWTMTLHKQQVSVNDGGPYSSYLFFMPDAESICLLYNDHKRNRQALRTKTKSMNNPSKSVCMMLRIKENGKVNLSPLFSNSEQNTILKPGVSYITFRNELIIYGEKRSAYRFGKISMN